MQAIKTKYVGPTNTLPARIIATCDAGTIRVSWNHELNVDENHASARDALIEKVYGWRGKWASGFIGFECFHVCYEVERVEP